MSATPPSETFAWLASIRDGNTVEWTFPYDQRYRCTDEPMSVGGRLVV